MKFRALSAFFVSSVVVVACSSSSSSGTAADAGTDAGTDAAVNGTDGGADGGSADCASFATTYCNSLNLCQPGALKASYGTVASCVTARTAQCAIDLAATGTGVTSSYLTACGTYLTQRATACAAAPAPLTVETQDSPCVIKGAAAAGAACGVDSQCASAICTRVGALCGTCTALATAGEGCDLATGVTCPHGMTCSGATSTCVKTAALNETCDLGVTSACVGGTSCVVAKAGDTGGTCQASGVAVGTACDPNAVGAPNCWEAAGVFCDNTSHCAAISYGASGATCGAPANHMSNAACAVGTCAGSACVGDATAGQACTVDGAPACAEGTVCVATGGGAAGTCTAVNNTTCTTAALVANFTFQPSNVSVAAINAAVPKAADESVSAACSVRTDASSPETDCFTSPIVVVTQPGGSKINVVVARSLSVEASAVITVTGGVPFVIVSLSDVAFFGQLVASSSGLSIGAGGGAPAASDAVGNGAGGGKAGSASSAIAGGGGSYCGIGGAGGGSASTAAAYGTPDIRPLVGGSAGGGGVITSGAGGGGIQIVAAGTLLLKPGSSITVGGQAGPSGGLAANQNAGGAGSGGSILLEGQAVTVNGILAANGGGGGGDYANTAADATPNATAAAGAAGGTSDAAGGAGAAGATIDGVAGAASGGINSGGGGGGAGRIRVNTTTGVAGGAAGTYSPAATTSCTTQGVVRALGSGA